MKKSGISLTGKLVGMVGLIIAALALSSFYSNHQLAKAFEEKLANMFEFKSAQLGNMIGAQFFERYGDVQAFALNETVQSMDANKMTEDLDSYVALYGIYDLVLVVDTKGDYVASNSKDPTGTAVRSKELAKYNYAKAPWFIAAIEGKTTDDSKKNFAGTYVEDFIKDPLMDVAFGESKYGSSFTSTIKDKEGKVIGVISNRAGARWIEAEFQRIYDEFVADGMNSVRMFVTNKEGQVIIEHDPSKNSAGKNVITRDEKTIFARNLAQEGFAPAVKAANKESGFLEDGHELVGYHHLDNDKWIESLGWNIIVMDEKSEAFAAVNQANMVFYTLFGIIVFLSIGAASWFSVLTGRRLSLIAKTLGDNSKQLAVTSTQISGEATSLSESSTEQAAAIQETVAAVEEINATVAKNAESANQSKQSSEESRENVLRGKESVEAVVRAIQDIDHSNQAIAQQFQDTTSQLTDITKLIVEIGNKTKVINEIVFQTKLLSFNASVEAARAGEYGKGFAVVAEEVGNLAQMSGNAAIEIGQMLEKSVKQVSEIVDANKVKVERLVDESKGKIDVGSRQAQECNSIFEEILEGVSKVDQLLSEIARASDEQASGIREISKAVGEIETSTQQNTNVAQSSAKASEGLKHRALELDDAIANLNMLVAGTSQSKAEAGSSRQEGSPLKPERAKAKVVSIAAKKKEQRPVVTAAEEKPEAPVAKLAASSDIVPSSNDPGFNE